MILSANTFQEKFSVSFFSATVSEDFPSKERLDKYIASLPGGMNRSKLKTGLKKILINGKEAKLSSKVKSGDTIEIDWEDSVPEDIKAEDIPLNIIYEDENVTVINKKQGMVTHPASGNWSGTLVNALLYHWGRSAITNDSTLPEAQQIEKRRPGIVHRLDKDTSGTIITAKNRESEEWLQNQFKARGLKKEYIAITTGVPSSRKGIIITHIVRDSHDRKKFKATDDTTRGKYACTLYRVIASYGPYALIRVRIKTGRTHQIRVHLKHIGCPILGDPIYGRSTKGTDFEGATLMLHARLLSIRLPGHKEREDFIAEVPVRFKKVMRHLHAKYGAKGKKS